MHLGKLKSDMYMVMTGHASLRQSPVKTPIPISLSHVPLFKKLSCEKEKIIVSLATMGPQKFSSILNSADIQGDVCFYSQIFFLMG